VTLLPNKFPATNET